MSGGRLEESVTEAGECFSRKCIHGVFLGAQGGCFGCRSQLAPTPENIAKISDPTVKAITS